LTDLSEAGLLAAVSSLGQRLAGRRCRYRRRIYANIEWTEHLTDVDPMEPVSSDEVIEVHSRLAKFDGSIAELLHQP